MRIDFNINDLPGFQKSCEAVIRNVEAGTKAATEIAVIDIISDALSEVPVDTGTLAASIFGGTYRRADTISYRYGAVIGFGDLRGLASELGAGAISWIIEPNNGVNPKTGLPASAYASRVHEDLDMPHPNGGKAKFLEDPVRNYAAGRFIRTAMTYWKRAIIWSKAPYTKMKYSKDAGIYRRMPGKSLTYKVRRYSFEQSSTGVQRGGTRVWKGADQ